MQNNLLQGHSLLHSFKPFGYQVQVSVLLLVAMWPSLTTLPSVLLIGFAVIALAKLVIKVQWRFASKIKLVLSLLLLVAWALFIHNSAVRWLSGESFLSGLLVVVALKWLESQSRREFKFLSLVSSVLLAIGCLHLSGIQALLYLVLGQLLVLYSLWLLNQPGTGTNVTVAQYLARVKSGFSQCGFSMLLALPFVIVLFLSVPRIQGPLWELGVVMGLPLEMMVDQKSRQLSGTLQLRSGNVSRAKGEDEPVLVADFASAVPSKSRLYWRGPIYDRFDGNDWLIKANASRNTLLKHSFKRRAQLDAALKDVADRVSYEARITTHGERWLYGLDMPYGSSAETFISEDFQLLRLNKRNGDFNYSLNAYLEYRGGRELTAQQRLQYTQLPELGNLQLRQWSTDLLKNSADSKDFVFLLGQALATSGFGLNAEQNTPQRDGLADYDQLFFKGKAGSLEQLNGIVAFTLRAAGIPSRIVTGYRGGSLIALTNFVIVKQAHAHAWLELWINGSGWQRFETEDLLNADSADKDSKSAKAAPAAKARVLKKVTPDSADASDSIAQAKGKSTAKKASKQGAENYFDWLANLSKSVKNWVMNYSPEQQVEILKKVGVKQVNWKLLLLISIAAMCLFVFVFTVLWRVRRKRVEPIAEQFHILNKFLVKYQLDCADNECPQRWITRLEKLAPQCLPALKHIIESYIKIRYRDDDKQLIKQQLKLLKRDIQRFKGMM
jgi:transglutaminase-like putative cysteine protease